MGTEVYPQGAEWSNEPPVKEAPDFPFVIFHFSFGISPSH